MDEVPGESSGRWTGGIGRTPRMSQTRNTSDPHASALHDHAHAHPVQARRQSQSANDNRRDHANDVQPIEATVGHGTRHHRRRHDGQARTKVNCRGIGCLDDLDSPTGPIFENELPGADPDQPQSHEVKSEPSGLRMRSCPVQSPDNPALPPPPARQSAPHSRAR